MTHSPQLGDVQSPCCPCVSSRSRSQLKVKYLTNKYYTLCRVRSLNPILMEGFPSNLNDTFTSTRGCAEPMLLMCQLKVKVTVKDQIFYKQILDIMSFRSITPLLMEGFPSNLNDTFTSTRGCAEPMLPTCQFKIKVTVKCQIFNKQILLFMSCLLYNSFTNWMTHSPQLGDVQSPCCPCVSSRSRSQLTLCCSRPRFHAYYRCCS